MYIFMEENTAYINKTVQNVDECEAFCLDNGCHFFTILDSGNGTECHLGSFDKNQLQHLTYPLQGLLNTFVNQDELESFLAQEIIQVPGFFNNLGPYLTSVISLSSQDCSLTCIFKKDLCDFYYWENGNCYQGLWNNIDSHLLSISGTQAIDVSVKVLEANFDNLPPFGHATYETSNVDMTLLAENQA